MLTKCLKSSRSAHFCCKAPAFPQDATQHQHHDLGRSKTSSGHRLKCINATNKWRKDPRTDSSHNFRQKSKGEQRDLVPASSCKLPHGHQPCQGVLPPWQTLAWAPRGLSTGFRATGPRDSYRKHWQAGHGCLGGAGAGLSPCKAHRLLPHSFGFCFWGGFGGF